uniref:DM2 domain-containing protein n=1 Tax=viral metagenome TaxID=1070528 RepID=A0A6C0H4P5_9ZZZZ
MPPHKKKSEQTTPSEVVPVEVVPVVVPSEPTKKSKSPKQVSEPVVEVKTESKPKATKATKSKVPEIVQTDVPVVVSDMENVVVASDACDYSITNGFTEFITKFQTMLASFNALKTELRSLEKITVKQLKVAEKLSNKKRRKGNRAPSGFVKPSLISDELAKFLDKPCGTEMARTDVTREINKYIRANNLQDKSNGRKINPDKQLTQLLKIEDTVDLTYFNLQKYMGPHFPKVVKVEPVVAVA